MTKVTVYRNYLEMEIDEGITVEKGWDSDYLFKLMNDENFDVEFDEIVEYTEVELDIYEDEGEADLYKHTFKIGSEQMWKNRWDRVNSEFIKTYKYLKSARKASAKLANRNGFKLLQH